MNYYINIWRVWGLNALQVAFVNRATNALFIVGKLFRLGMSLVFLFLIRSQVTQVGEYNTDQLVIFFLVYLWVDTLSQALFRGVYTFGRDVRDGMFDFDLLKPLSPLFRALMGKPDINDVVFIIPTALLSVWVLLQLSIPFTFANILLFILLLVNSFAIATGLHIIVLCVALLTTDVDGAAWMYRDLIRLGQFPVTIYPEFFRFVLFFLVPVGMMLTIPAEVLINETPEYSIVLSLAVTAVTLLASTSFWRWCLKQYSSASS